MVISPTRWGNSSSAREHHWWTHQRLRLSESCRPKWTLGPMQIPHTNDVKALQEELAQVKLQVDVLASSTDAI